MQSPAPVLSRKQKGHLPPADILAQPSLTLFGRNASSQASFRAICRLSNKTISFCGVGAHHPFATSQKQRALCFCCMLATAGLTPCTFTFGRKRSSMQSIFATAYHGIRCWEPALQIQLHQRLAKPEAFSQFMFWKPLYKRRSPSQSGQSARELALFLPRHTSSVPLILNTQTGLVSPQFHCVYDDSFDTVAADAKFESLWQRKAKLHNAMDDKSVGRSPTDPTLEQEANLPSYAEQQIPTLDQCTL